MNRSSKMIFGFCLVALFILWLPGLKYPVVSDTAFYALLGDSFWNFGKYHLFGMPYAKHLPLHAIVSYPFVGIFGATLGMKISSLLSGFGVLIATYLLLEKVISEKVAIFSVVFVTFNHAFVLMTQLGSADLLFSMLFLFSVYAYILSGKNKKLYLHTFILAGLACLTRYNGAPLFLLFVGHAAIFRRRDLISKYFLGGLLAGAAFFGLWFLRNSITFGDLFYTEYTGELAAKSSGVASQLLSNIIYYINPIHNILPVLFIFALLGIITNWKKHGFLIFVMLTAWVITSIWWVQAMRFVFPGYPILIGFGVLGMTVVSCKLLAVRKKVFMTVITLLIVISHSGALCLYSYGECNALFDKHIGIISEDLNITSEGFYAWHRAREFVRENAEEGATVFSVGAPKGVWNESVFRPDIIMTDKETCGSYQITQNPPDGSQVVFTTEEHPKTSVILNSCP